MRIWKLSHGKECFGLNELNDLRLSNQVCVARDTAAMGTRHVTQGDDFMNNVQEGDFFYLCYSNSSIELLGRFKNKKRKKDGWVYREYECIFESIQKDKSYNKEARWWTPNFNSTFVEIKEHDQKDFERLILKPFFGKSLNNITELCQEKKVTLFEENLNKVLEYDLNIPDYQRIYCWRESNVIQLLKDCQGLTSEYRLGSIILQKQGEKYDIIDGQQRLVTLSIILQTLGYCDIKLLKQKFNNGEAIKYLKYNKWIIEKFIKANRKSFDYNNLLKYISLNVLVLNNESRELAYTFFSNENSRGKALSDFDLLKAHHLRYVYEERQAKHLSKRWDNLLIRSNNEPNNEDKDYVRTLGLYIFRLRKWLNYEDWNEFEPLRIKKEYEAAPTIDDIPSFGEKFDYSEPIQGGAHFFAYVERFVDHYHTFIQTPQYIALHHNLVGETHTWIRDTIEAFLFAYFIKFGVDYLDDALVLISRIMAQVRYTIQRIHLQTVLEYAKESKIAMIIERSTSPTFCLASMLAYIETLEDFEGEFKDGKSVKRIRFRFHNCLCNMVNERVLSKVNYTIANNIIKPIK